MPLRQDEVVGFVLGVALDGEFVDQLLAGFGILPDAVEVGVLLVATTDGVDLARTGSPVSGGGLFVR